jgi:hypothetical protein
MSASTTTTKAEVSDMKVAVTKTVTESRTFDFYGDIEWEIAQAFIVHYKHGGRLSRAIKNSSIFMTAHEYCSHIGPCGINEYRLLFRWLIAELLDRKASVRIYP